MRKLLLPALLLLFLSTFTASGFGQDPSDLKVAVHLGLHETGAAICDEAPELHGIGCGSFVTAGDLMTGYDLYIVVAGGDSSKGVAGVTFGISYDGAANSGVDIFGTPKFNLCANGLQYPSSTWPAPGSGTSITWNPQTGCQRTVLSPYGVHATAGAFYVYAYSEDRFKVTENTQLQTPVLSVANCSSAETNLPDGAAGHAAFGVGPGCNPCVYDPCIPVERVTWSRIKTMFSHRND